MCKCRHSWFVDGHLEVKNSLCLRPTAKVSGNVYMESLTVEPGAEFNANCKMLSTIKELNTHKVEATKENKQQVSKIS